MTRFEKLIILILFVFMWVVVAYSQTNLPVGTVRKPIMTDAAGNVVSTNIVFSNQVTMVPAPTLANHLVRFTDLTNAIATNSSSPGATISNATSNIPWISVSNANRIIFLSTNSVKISSSNTSGEFVLTNNATFVACITNVLNVGGGTSMVFSVQNNLAKLLGLKNGSGITLAYDTGQSNIVISATGGGSSNLVDIATAPILVNTANGTNAFTFNMDASSFTNANATTLFASGTKIPYGNLPVITVTNVVGIGGGSNLVHDVTGGVASMATLLPGANITITAGTGSSNYTIAASGGGGSPVTNLAGLANVVVTTNFALNTSFVQTNAHSFGTIPSLVSTYLYCIASDNGFASNDYVFLPPTAIGTANAGMTIQLDTNNCITIMGTGTVWLEGRPPSGGTFQPATTKWQVFQKIFK